MYCLKQLLIVCSDWCISAVLLRLVPENLQDVFVWMDYKVWNIWKHLLLQYVDVFNLTFWNKTSLLGKSICIQEEL